MSWAVSTMIWSCSRQLSNTTHPDCPVNVLDCCSYITLGIMFQAIPEIGSECPGQVLPWCGLGPGYLWIPIIISQTILSMSWTAFHITLPCSGPYMTLWTTSQTIFELCCECPGRFLIMWFAPDYPISVHGLLLVWYYLDPDHMIPWKMSWTVSDLALNHAVNVLSCTCCSYNTIMDPMNNFPNINHSLIWCEYYYICVTFLLQAIFKMQSKPVICIWYKMTMACVIQ